MPMSEYMRGIREKVGSQLLEMPSVGIVTFDARRRVLLVRHAELQVWTVPGGAVEPNEVPADAAVREAWEETGLFVELTGIRGVYGGPDFVVTYANGDAISYVVILFEAQPIGGHLRPDGVETLEAAYFARDELSSLSMQPWVRILVDETFDPTPQPYFRSPTWAPPKP
jgi:ADP-ribose pyrophosphatase YjhB (NUDIX family)